MPPVERPAASRTMSEVHVQPDGDQVWIAHSAIAGTGAGPRVAASQLGAYLPATHQFVAVLDTTGALGKRILFPGHGRVLYVAQRGSDRDVFVTVDAAEHRPLAQRSYPGDRGEFRLSPSGRALIATDRTDQKLHLLDTASLVDQVVPGGSDLDPVIWATGEDVLYRLRPQGTSTEVQRFDLRTADLRKPLPLPSVVTTLPGLGDWPAVAPDDRFLALVIDAGTSASRIAMIDLAAATTRTIAGDVVPAFTNDDRVVVWQLRPDDTHDLRIVDPATGAASPPVATELVFPVGIPLRHHDLVLAASTLFEPVAFLYRLA
ncbi:MAG TPA: hypothetical protein VK601_20700, partial [Kofleriaceae bacterium]|nr:hypothetical protein [Kofleriaceae bacterium]